MTLKRSLLSERSGRLSDNKGVNAFPFEEFSHEHVNFFALWLKKSVKVHQILITIGDGQSLLDLQLFSQLNLLVINSGIEWNSWGNLERENLLWFPQEVSLYHEYSTNRLNLNSWIMKFLEIKYQILEMKISYMF